MIVSLTDMIEGEPGDLRMDLSQNIANLISVWSKIPLVTHLVPLVHKTVYNVRKCGYNRILGCFSKGPPLVG